jgi:hypothetical protein
VVTLRHLTPSSVFAIQKCDPAPFYLFDEVRGVFFFEIYLLTVALKIDANLDAQYRTAVAGKCKLFFHAVFSHGLSDDPFSVLIRPIHHDNVST